MLNKPFAAVAAVALLSAAVAPARAEPVKNVVLVHGAFADGSGWQRVADILGKDGYTVSVVQEPLTSLADDAAATKRVLDLQQGPTLLVGHSYGGVVITEAGNAPKSSSASSTSPLFHPRPRRECGRPARAGRRRQQRHARHQGRFSVPRAGRVPGRFRRRRSARPGELHGPFSADAGKAAGGAPVTTAAWHQKKSWALVATRDHNINPDSSSVWHGQAGRQRNDRGSGQPRGVRVQAGGGSAFDRTGGKSAPPSNPFHPHQAGRHSNATRQWPFLDGLVAVLSKMLLRGRELPAA